MTDTVENATLDSGGDMDYSALFGGDEETGDSAPQQNTAEAVEHPETDSDSGTIEEESADAPESDSVDNGESDAEGEEAEPEGDAEDPEYEITSNGQPVKVKLSELQKGYLRQQDYTQKTAELSQQKTAFEAESTEKLRQQATALNQVVHLLNSFDPVPRIAQELQQAREIGDVEMEMKLRLDLQDAQQLRARIAEDLQNVKTEINQVEQKSDAEFVAEQRTALAEKFPFLSDPKRKESFENAMLLGFEKAGYDSAKDKRPNAGVAALAYYAGLYHQSQQQRPKVAEAIKGKVVTPKPGARSTDGGKGAQREQAFKRFASNPNEEGNLAEVLNAINF